MTVITRIAPSPTGFMHIGTARTALFNWLYAKHHGGKFYMRIEDTDRERSTPEATQAIIDGMRWLGLDWEGDVVYQYSRVARHADVAHELLKHGKAYRCYTTQEELDAFRKANPNAKFRSPWRDRHEHPDKPYVIRIKAQLEGETVVQDKVQGTVTLKSSELDDMVLLRSDGTPTYMLAVVVDDHDMGVTHVIRGDDHLTNTFRQLMIYTAMDWDAPEFAHIPLIHGPDGAKLSKRHGALGVQEYEKMGYLPEALRNYLLRLGWSHGDDEIISTEQAIKWFDLDAVGKSPSRFDFIKLNNLNAHYIRESDNAWLAKSILEIMRDHPDLVSIANNDTAQDILTRGMSGLKQRATNLVELADNATFYIEPRPLLMEGKAKDILDKGGRDTIKALLPKLEAETNWNHAALELLCRAYGESAGQKLGNIAQPIRAALSGKTTSPPIFEVMEVLGREETLGRLRDIS